MQLDRTARRVLGSLIEKRMSTPDQYPLTLNSLVLACNQRSNRDPFLDLASFAIEGCLTQLRIGGYLMVVERDTGRSVRYKERLTESLGLSEREAAVLAELLLRGPQTEQELAKRTERMIAGMSVDDALAVLAGLTERKIVEHLPRRSGERIARWRHLLAPAGEVELVQDADSADPVRGESQSAFGSATSSHAPSQSQSSQSTQPTGASVPTSGPDHSAEIAALRDEVELLQLTVEDLRSEVRALRGGLDRLQHPS